METPFEECGDCPVAVKEVCVVCPKFNEHVLKRAKELSNGR